MGLSFDGTDIIKKPKLDLDRYRRWQQKQEERLGRIRSEAAGKATGAARKAWAAMVPDVYKGATLESVKSYDPEAADRFRELADLWASGKKRSNVLIYSNNDSRGKTWALYAWLTELVDRGVYQDPQREIVIVNEAWLTDDLYGFKTREAAKARLMDDHVKMIAVDSVGRVTHSDAVAQAAWGMFKECISGRRLNLSCVADQSIDPENQSLYMKQAVRRLKDFGIYDKLTPVELKSEPAHIRDMN